MSSTIDLTAATLGITRATLLDAVSRHVETAVERESYFYKDDDAEMDDDVTARIGTTSFSTHVPNADEVPAGSSGEARSFYVKLEDIDEMSRSLDESTAPHVPTAWFRVTLEPVDGSVPS